MAEFRARAARSRIPISAALELTRRCNFRCRHCYLGEQVALHRTEKPELDTAAVLRAVNEWADAGILKLLITGGDPLLRRDFPDIYLGAVRRGLVVTVFCNGSLVSERIAELFREWPPSKVEITLYGATPETYARVTRKKDAFEMAWAGIRRLLAAGIRVTLKSVVMTLNQHELDAMERQAREVGCDFRYDTALFAGTNGGAREALNLRVSPESAVAMDLATEERRRAFANVARNGRDLSASDRLYRCSAGVTSFFADPFGNLSPCLLAQHYACSAEGRPFPEIWERDLARIHERRATRRDTVLAGPRRGACRHCPAFNYLETGNEECESEYLRRTAELRYKALADALKGTES